jgi:DNA polymerase-3 subunit beta
MKLTIEKNRLAHVLSTVAKGMSSRSTLPILSGVYVEATEKQVIFQTTDLEVAIRHIDDALIEQTGSTVVPGKLFSEIVKSLPDAAVSLALENDILSISCLDSHFTLHTLGADDFPSFPSVTTSKTIRLSSASLAGMVKKVSKAVSKDESRAVLTGILFKADLDSLQLVATDSYRLAITKTQLETPVSEPFNLIIPGSIFDEISRLSVGDESIEVSDSDNQIVFNFGNTTFITRKIEGNYPNYEQIIPNQKTVSANVDTAALLSAVRRASILAQAHTPIKFKVSPEIQFIDVSSSTQDIGGAEERLSAQVEGEALEIGFNHQYVIDGLSAVDTEEVLFEAQTPLKPGILKAVGDDYYFYLTMPVRLDH